MERRYELREPIARGHFGAVWRAWDPNWGGEVAAKVMHGHLITEVAFLRFRREAEVTRSLRHDNIVAVYDYGAHQDGDEATPYMIMEQVAGRSLAEHLEATEPPEVEVVVGWLVVQAATGLGFAHARGVAHRDIKPENFLLTPSGRLQVADFGTAISDGETRLSRGFIGTGFYAAPEQFAGDADARSDVYALGVVAYRCLTAVVVIGRVAAADPAVDLVAVLDGEDDPVAEAVDDTTGGGVAPEASGHELVVTGHPDRGDGRSSRSSQRVRVRW